GNIGAPDLVGALDRDTPQQVGIHRVAGRRTAQVWFRIKSFDTQNPHQSLAVLPIDTQRDRHAPAAEEGTLQVQFVEPAEQAQVLRTLGSRLVDNTLRGTTRLAEGCYGATMIMRLTSPCRAPSLALRRTSKMIQVRLQHAGYFRAGP